jgi:hypothetical protein
MTQPMCTHGQGLTGRAVQRCQDRAVQGSVYCATHRDEGLRRVKPVRSEVAALRASLRWPGVVWTPGRTW